MAAFPPPHLFSEELVINYVNQETPLARSLSLSGRNVVVEANGEKYVLHTMKNEFELYMMIRAGICGIAPRVIAVFPKKKWVLMELVNSPTITPKIAQQHCKEIGGALKKAHMIDLFTEKGVGFEGENQIRWKYIQLRASLHKTDVMDSLLNGAIKAMNIFEEGVKSLSELHSNLKANIHTNLHPRNLFWTKRGFLIINWEHSSHGHPYFDAASLTIFLGFNEAQEIEFLSGYFNRPPTLEELSEYALLKKIRLAYTSIIYTMWAFRTVEKELSPSNLKNQEFDKKTSQNFCSDRTIMAERQGATENENYEVKPTQPKTDSSSYLTIPSDPIKPPNETFGTYMQSFAETKGIPSREFFVNAARLINKEIEHVS